MVAAGIRLSHHGNPVKGWANSPYLSNILITISFNYSISSDFCEFFVEALHKLWFFRLASHLSSSNADCVEMSLTFRVMLSLWLSKPKPHKPTAPFVPCMMYIFYKAVLSLRKTNQGNRTSDRIAGSMAPAVEQETRATAPDLDQDVSPSWKRWKNSCKGKK